MIKITVRDEAIQLMYSKAMLPRANLPRQRRANVSRHAVVCQRPRKPRGAQVCYLCKPPLTPFQPIVV